MKLFSAYPVLRVVSAFEHRQSTQRSDCVQWHCRMSIMPAVCHALYTGHNLAADQFYLLCIAGPVGVIGIHSLSLTPDAGRASSCYFPYPLFLPSLLPFLDSFLQPVTSSIVSLPDKTFFPLFDLYFYSRSLPPVAIICKHHHTRNIHIYTLLTPTSLAASCV